MRRFLSIGCFVLVLLMGLAPTSSGIDIEMTVLYPVPCDGSTADGIDTVWSTGPGAEVTVHSGYVSYGDEAAGPAFNCRWAAPECWVRNLVPMVSYTFEKQFDIWAKNNLGQWIQTYKWAWTGPHTVNSGGNSHQVWNADQTRYGVYEWYSHIEIRREGETEDDCGQDYGYIKTYHMPED